MAVVTFGVTSSDIDLAVSWMEIDASSEPNQTRVSSMISQFAGPLNLALEAAGINPSTISSSGSLYSSCQGSLIRRVATEVVYQNQRESSDFVESGLTQWDDFLAQIQAGQFSALGTETPPASNVQGAFNSQSIVTTRPSRNPRLGLWRKGIGFN